MGWFAGCALFIASAAIKADGGSLGIMQSRISYLHDSKSGGSFDSKLGVARLMRVAIRHHGTTVAIKIWQPRH